MNIIIIGCGKIGSTLAEQLNHENHNIAVVDINEKVVNNLAMDLDVIGVNGNGAILSVQKEAGLESADLLIAATGSDELNMLICLIAKKEGHCATIARIRNTDYENEIEYLKNELGMAMVINPEQLCAREITRLLRFPSALEIEAFSSGKAEMIKMLIPEGSPLIGLALKDLPKINANVLVSMIERGKDIIIPTGTTVFEKNDKISFIARAQDAMAFTKKCNLEFHPNRSAFIVGAGRITHYICENRKNAKNSVSIKVVDNNEKACNDLAVKYQDITVINGDGTDQDLLKEEGVQDAEVFMTLTGIDEQNVMLSMIAQETTKARLITKVNHMEPSNIPSSVDIGSILCPKTITANSVVRFARAMENSANCSITSLYKLAGGRAEAQEYKVLDEPEITERPIRDLKIKNGVLIAAIIRNGKLVRPTGSDMISAGDHIVVVCKSELNIRDIGDIIDYV